MTVSGDLLQHVAHAGLGADEGVVRDSQLLGDGVGGLEADAMDVEGEPVGVLADLLDRLVPIGLVDAHRPCRADAVGLEEDHDLPDDLLLRPGAGYPLLALGTDTFQLQQPVGAVLDDVEHPLAEGPYQLAGEVRADALHHTRAQVLLDAVQGARRDDPEGRGLELEPVLAVVDPSPLAFDVLAGGDGRRRADHSHQVPLTAHLHAQHAEAALPAVEGDPLDGAGEALGGCVVGGAGGIAEAHCCPLM